MLDLPGQDSFSDNDISVVFDKHDSITHMLVVATIFLSYQEI